MAKIIDYKILTDTTIGGLNHQVKDYVEDGWTPVGSHQERIKDQYETYSGKQHMSTIRKYEFSQTMVKYEPYYERRR